MIPIRTPLITTTSSLAATMLICLLAPAFLLAQTSLDGLTRPIEGRSMHTGSAFRKGADGKLDPNADPLGNDEEQSNFDNRLIKPGQSLLLLDAEGPGIITHLWFTFPAPGPRAANHQEFLLRITYDGAERPSIEVPFGDFFANCFGKRSEINSVPVAVQDGDAYNCYWHMPFQKRARVEIVNDGAKPISGFYYNIDWIKKPSLPQDTLYFYARYRQEYPQQNSKDYLILDTQGRGHYVGTVLAVRTRSPIWFGEGDEKIYIDGETKPSIWGTGTEDYFCCACGLEPCKFPYFGVPYFNQYEIVGSMTSAYRWHVTDPIVFNTALKVTIEHKSWITEDENPRNERVSVNEREDDYASVAFWYQTGTPTPGEPVPPAAQRHLPSLERVTALAHLFTDAQHHGAGAASVQHLDGLFENPILFYAPETPANAWVEIPIEVQKKEPLRLLINAACAPDYGRYQASLDGVKIGPPLDFFSADLKDQEFHLLDFWPEPGTYQLRLDCVGKSSRSDGYFLGVESVRLRERRPRVEKYGRDKDNDWRKNPLFYTIR